MRSSIVCLGMFVAAIAVAGPKLPAAPGNPPSLAKVPAEGVTLVVKGKAMPLEVLLEGRETWELKLFGEKTTVRIALPELVVGTKRGAKAQLDTGAQAGREGPWVVEITSASVGYLKRPGICSGKIAAWFAKDVYIVGTFKAGCIAYHPPP